MPAVIRCRKDGRFCSPHTSDQDCGMTCKSSAVAARPTLSRCCLEEYGTMMMKGQRLRFRQYGSIFACSGVRLSYYLGHDHDHALRRSECQHDPQRQKRISFRSLSGDDRAASEYQMKADSCLVFHAHPIGPDCNMPDYATDVLLYHHKQAQRRSIAGGLTRQ